MPEIERIARSIEATVSGPMWHGSAIVELLDGVTAADAASHPIAGAHSIWEVVLHVGMWAEIVERRLAFGPRDDTLDDRTDADWPPVPARLTEAAWGKARKSMLDKHLRLAAAVRALDPALLDKRVSGRDYSARTMLHGVVEHGAYHGGQIDLLTRARQDRLKGGV